MKTVKLGEIAYARSGDKGDGSNVGVFFTQRAHYEQMKQFLTAVVVQRHFHAICRGKVVRFEMDNILALNFLLGDSLGGGGSESLKTDAQGKTHGLALLELEVAL